MGRKCVLNATKWVGGFFRTWNMPMYNLRSTRGKYYIYRHFLKNFSSVPLETMLWKLFPLYSLQINRQLRLISRPISFMRPFPIPLVRGHPDHFGTLLHALLTVLRIHIPLMCPLFFLSFLLALFFCLYVGRLCLFCTKLKPLEMMEHPLFTCFL